MKKYVARQPILNDNIEIVGYELLFRDGNGTGFPDIDGSLATSQVLSTSFFTFDIEELSGGKPVFINFTEELLEAELPCLFPKEKIIVEVLETVCPSPAVLKSLEKLSKSGYIIALDDFIYDPSLEPLIDLAHIIKFDFRTTDIDEIREMADFLRPRKKVLLAEKVETKEEFALAKELGCTHFQGYFFSKPELLMREDLKPVNMNMMQLLHEIYKDEFDIAAVETQINADLSLTYKLLRHLNSALFSLDHEIKSIRHAISYLGISETKKFISFIALSEMSSDKPEILVVNSIIRAKFCELIASATSTMVTKEELFLLGLFSQIDAILDQEMVEVMKNLPLSLDHKEALVNEQGVLAEFLALTVAYESGNWRRVSTIARRLAIEESLLPDCYSKAILFSNKFNVA